MTQQTQRRERVTARVIPAQQAFAGGGDTRSFQAGDLADFEAERALVGAVLQEPDLYLTAASLVQPGDFYTLSHGYVWHAFEKLVDTNTPIDILSVAAYLDREPKAPIKGDQAIDLLTQLYAAPPVAGNAEYYARRVRESATAIRLLGATVEMQKLVFDKQARAMPEALIDRCNELLFAATDQQMNLTETQIGALVDMYVEKLGQRSQMAQSPSVLSGWIKWDDADHATGGLFPGDVTVVVGMEGFGKTTWVLSMIRNMLKAGKHIVLFTLEMKGEGEITPIFMSMESGVPKSVLRSGMLTDTQWERFVLATPEVSGWNLHVVDEFRSLTPYQLRRKLRVLLSKQPVDVVVIDGLWLMKHQDESLERKDAVSEIMRELDEIAKGALGVPMPILITHQYNGEVASKKVKKPTLYMLAESAGVRRNAQVVIGLWRAPGSDFMEAHLLKDRNVGNTGYTGYFRYVKTRSLYEEAE